MKKYKVKKRIWMAMIIGLLALVYCTSSTVSASIDDIDIKVGTKAHIENPSDLQFIYLNQNKGTYVVNITNVYLLLEDGSRTTLYNNYIYFEFDDTPYYLKSGQSNMVKTIFYDEGLHDPWFCTVDADYGIPDGTVCFDILVTLKKSDIKMNKKKITIYLDNTEGGETISVKGANSAVTWKSSNKKIARVYTEEDDDK